jgi:hypothetical protein
LNLRETNQPQKESIYNDKLHGLYSSFGDKKCNRNGQIVAHAKKVRHAHRTVVVNSKIKRP